MVRREPFVIRLLDRVRAASTVQPRHCASTPAPRPRASPW
ncbi:hypothetical protein [Halorhodospira neutriphila]